MKRIFKLLIISIVLTSFTSCFDNFLSVTPVSDLTDVNFWKTETDVVAGLNGVYNYVANTYCTGPEYDYLMWFECRAADTWHVQRQNVKTLAINTNRPNAALDATDWNKFYKAIARANYAIYYIKRMNNLSNESKNHYLAEAYFLRAKMYFDLVRIWGDVPLVVEPTLDSDIEKMYVHRENKDKVMEQISADLDFSIKNANPNIRTDKFKFSLCAAYALATHVQMWKHDYEAAFNTSTKILELTFYSLTPADKWTDIFKTGITSENIWTIKWSYANNGNNSSGDILSRELSGISLNKPFLAKWKTEPYEKQRRFLSYDTTRVADINHLIDNCYGFGLWKWFGPGNVGRAEGKNETFIIGYRLADIYLLRAEAANMLDNTDEAIKYVNKVRERIGYPVNSLTRLTVDTAITMTPKDSLATLILYERKKELLGEGQRWFDLVRTNKAVEYNNAVFKTYYEPAGLSDFILFTGTDCEKYLPINTDIIIESKGNIVDNCYGNN